MSRSQTTIGAILAVLLVAGLGAIGVALGGAVLPVAFVAGLVGVLVAFAVARRAG